MKEEQEKTRRGTTQVKVTRREQENYLEEEKILQFSKKSFTNNLLPGRMLNY